MHKVVIWAKRKEDQILDWAKRDGRKTGRDEVRILLAGILLVILLVILIALGCSESKWLFTPYATFGVFYFAWKRFRIADQQLESTNQQLEIARSKEDLDRHKAGMDLLARKDLSSQLLGVSILRVLLETKQAEGPKDVRNSLENIIRENWERNKAEGEERKMNRKARDEIIMTLCPTYIKGEESFNLSSLDLRGAYLIRAGLCLADLSKADLRGARLGGADLSGAYLDGADLSEALLEGANLMGAKLINANLSGAYLGGANLSVATLERARLNDVHLERADLGDAKLNGADLSGAHLEGANLSNIDFKQVNGLDKNISYKGIWAYRGYEPKGLPAKLMDELQANLKEFE